MPNNEDERILGEQVRLLFGNTAASLTSATLLSVVLAWYFSITETRLRCWFGSVLFRLPTPALGY